MIKHRLAHWKPAIRCPLPVQTCRSNLSFQAPSGSFRSVTGTPICANINPRADQRCWHVSGVTRHERSGFNVWNSAARMRVCGIVIDGPKRVGVRRLDISPPPGDWVKVRIEACGLCTWEQRVYRGVKPTYPFWGGHEVTGVVDECSPGLISDVKPGDRVALALLRRCGACELCRRGLDNHCVYARPEVSDQLPPGPRGLNSLCLKSFPI
jgi:hypothetical protein